MYSLTSSSLTRRYVGVREKHRQAHLAKPSVIKGAPNLLCYSPLRESQLQKRYTTGAFRPDPALQFSDVILINARNCRTFLPGGCCVTCPPANQRSSPAHILDHAKVPDTARVAIESRRLLQRRAKRITIRLTPKRGLYRRHEVIGREGTCVGSQARRDRDIIAHAVTMDTLFRRYVAISRVKSFEFPLFFFPRSLFRCNASPHDSGSTFPPRAESRNATSVAVHARSRLSHRPFPFADDNAQALKYGISMCPNCAHACHKWAHEFHIGVARCRVGIAGLVCAFAAYDVTSRFASLSGAASSPSRILNTMIKI